MLIANLGCSCKKSPILYSCTDFELRGKNLFLFLFTGCRAQLPMSLIDIFFKSREKQVCSARLATFSTRFLAFFDPFFAFFDPFFAFFD